MFSKVLFGALTIIALLAAPLAVAAAGQSGNLSIEMRGEAQVDRSQRTPQLLISADATDGSYHLDTTLMPVAGSQAQRGRGEREGGGDRGAQSAQVTSLAGRFTLTGSGFTAVNGDASGLLNSDGTGSLNLTSPDGITQIEARFAADNFGNLELTLVGLMPSASQQSGQTSQSAVVNGQQTDHTFWFISRAAGLSAYLMLFLNVVLGLAVNTRFMDALVARWRSFDLHEFTALLAMGLLAVHGLALVGDRYIGFTLPQILVPLNLPYRPFWTAMGIMAFYVLALVTASSYMRKQLSYRAWRGIHYLSFGAFVMALAHGIMAGTDSSMPWAQGLYLTTGAATLLLTVWRFFRKGKKVQTRAGVERNAGRAG